MSDIQDSVSDQPKAAPASGPRRRRTIAPWWSIGLLLIFLPLYLVGADATFAITVWPAWIWALVGLPLALLARHWRPWLVGGWLLFLVLFADEARSIPRLVMPAGKSDFRVVTLNCAGGLESAALEVGTVKPDLVLFQESPSEVELRRVAQKLFGPEAAVLRGVDASIIARGRLEPVPLPRGTSNFVAARWTHPGGQSLNIVSLRLQPPVMRIDLYDPAAWTDFARNRALRRLEAQEMAAVWQSMEFAPDIVGGDFNTPPDQSSLSPLVGGKADAFGTAGVGLGATCVNPYPCLVRIDQIWSGERVQPVRAWVVGSENSDHRMLAADYRFSGPGKSH